MRGPHEMCGGGSSQHGVEDLAPEIRALVRKRKRSLGAAAAAGELRLELIESIDPVLEVRVRVESEGLERGLPFTDFGCGLDKLCDDPIFVEFDLAERPDSRRIDHRRDSTLDVESEDLARAGGAPDEE